MSTSRPLVRRRALGQAALVFVLLALAAACDLSGLPSTVPSGSPPRGSCGPEEIAEGGIDGRVIDADGNPLNDILVQIQTLGAFRGTARTGDDGVFTAPGVSGDFQLTTTDIDYQDLVREVTVPCGELVEVELVLTPAEP